MTIDESWYTRPPDVKDRTSAGGIVVRREEERVLVALTREEGITEFVLPKGGVKKGEELIVAARREIEEEAGFSQLELLTPLGPRSRLSYDRRRWITTHYFLFRTMEQEPCPTDPKHAYAPAWFDLDAPLPPMLWPEQRLLLESEQARIRDLVLKG